MRLSKVLGRLLPPQRTYPNLRVRAAASIDLRWQEGSLARASLRSYKGGDYELAYQDEAMTLRLRAGETAHVVLLGDRLVRA